VKAVVWHSPHYGPAFAAILPLKEGEHPDTARIPQGVPPGVEGQLLSKGEKTTWPQWGDHLTGRLPYGGSRWSVEDVPDGYDAHAALWHVREKSVSQGLDSSQGLEVYSGQEPELQARALPGGRARSRRYVANAAGRGTEHRPASWGKHG
jgi:hypothetical protein